MRGRGGVAESPPLRQHVSVQFVQFGLPLRMHAMSPKKRTGGGVARRVGARLPSSPKVAEIVRLVHTLSCDLGKDDGVIVGIPLAQLLIDAYREQGRPLPGWVKQLAAHYGVKERST